MDEEFSVVTKIARQVEGDYILVNVLGAFKDKDKLKEFLSGQVNKKAENIDGVDYVVELGVIEGIKFLD